MISDVIKQPLPRTDAEWEALIVEAPGEDRPLDPVEEQAFWENAVVVYAGGPAAVRAALAEKRRARGLQKAPRKVATTIRFDAEVLAALKASGKGWQTRVNAIVRQWVQEHQPRG